MMELAGNDVFRLLEIPSLMLGALMVEIKKPSSVLVEEGFVFIRRNFESPRLRLGLGCLV